MVFPMGVKAPMSKKPKFDMGGEDIGETPVKGGGDFDDEEIDGIMGQDITNPMGAGSDDVLGGGDPLESALTDAGFAVTPEQLTQIQAILKPAKPPMMGAGKPAPAMGGATAGSVQSSDIAGL